ncbi:LuxR C-terminal-related transcriptional regulator [Luedemannella flava]
MVRPDGRGADVAARLTGMLPEARVVVVTMYDDDGSVREALAAGASGYVVKDASPAQLVAAVRAAEQGAVVLGSGVAPAAGLRVRAPAADPFGLTPRERDVLDLLVRGLSNPQIAERLAVSGKTVSNNVSALLAKLGAADRARRPASPARPSTGDQDGPTRRAVSTRSSSNRADGSSRSSPSSSRSRLSR